MKRRHLLQVALATIALGAAMSNTSCFGNEDMSIHETPDWKTNAYSSGIQLRRERAPDGPLLMKKDENKIVRRFDPSSSVVTEVSLDSWRSAAGPVVDCEAQFQPASEKLGKDSVTGALRDPQGEIKTMGKTILSLTAGPKGDQVAILSAEGEKPASDLPFGGSSGASGQYWHQVWSMQQRRFVGPALKVPVMHKFDSLRACWSADEGVVVYYDATFSYLVVAAS